MKRKMLLLIILGVLLAGCKPLGFCEEDGRYYYVREDVVKSMRDCGRFCEYFRGLFWCPFVEPTPIPEPTPTPMPMPEPTPTPEPTRIPAQPLFKMWLLTNGEKMCMIISETHPSVERQQILCGWVADNAPCSDYVYDDNTWSCDSFGGLRLPLHGPGRDLMEVWHKHDARGE